MDVIVTCRKRERMKTRMKRLISLITAAALCLSCIPMSVVYASDEIISVAEAVPEDVDANCSRGQIVTFLYRAR